MIFRNIFPVFLFLFFALSTQARVSRVEITSIENVMGGASFGAYGSYEILKGNIYFEFDPFHKANRGIVDIAYAPTNAAGRVEAYSSIVILKPTDATKARGVALVEVSNRGGMFSSRYFNRSNELNPAPGDPGIHLLMKQGLTVIWIGWQFDIPSNPKLLKLHVPTIKGLDGLDIMGMVRSDWTVEKAQSVLSLGHRNQIGYPVGDRKSPVNKLTKRSGRNTPRIEVPRDRWRFAKLAEDTSIMVDDYHIYLEGGFEPGYIYELVYQAKEPVVVGLGIAAIRDVISYVKYDPQALIHANFGIAVGVSQTGRFIRQFLYQNFNVDESDRKAYDGALVITAGAGRGSFNHRFAQPSRDGHRYSAFFYPTDLYPFTGATQFDPSTFKSQGLLSNLKKEHQPKIFYINTGYEYWGRAASLIHTTTDGTKDVAPLPNERIYHLASGQHYVDRFPPKRNQAVLGTRKFRGNGLNFSVNYRALLVALLEWVADDQLPPDSKYPKINDGTLVSFKDNKFPDIPGVAYPSTIHTAYRLSYGSRWGRGIIDQQPPEIIEEFTPKVSTIDALGNELAGIRNVEITVPLATYTPWNLRTGYSGGAHELTDFRGSYFPFPRKDKEKKITGDPRPSIKSLYKNKKAYLQQVTKAAYALSEERFLLEEEIDLIIENAGKHWDWIHKKLPRM